MYRRQPFIWAADPALHPSEIYFFLLTRGRRAGLTYRIRPCLFDVVPVDEAPPPSSRTAAMALKPVEGNACRYFAVRNKAPAYALSSPRRGREYDGFIHR